MKREGRDLDPGISAGRDISAGAREIPTDVGLVADTEFHGDKRSAPGSISARGDARSHEIRYASPRNPKEIYFFGFPTPGFPPFVKLPTGFNVPGTSDSSTNRNSTSCPVRIEKCMLLQWLQIGRGSGKVTSRP